MKPMKDMNRTEMIELVAAVTFRVMAFSYAFSALMQLFVELINLWHSEFSSSPVPQFGNPNYQIILGFLTSAITALLFFRLAVPLARLVTRGLSQALELKPSLP